MGKQDMDLGRVPERVRRLVDRLIVEEFEAYIRGKRELDELKEKGEKEITVRVLGKGVGEEEDG